MNAVRLFVMLQVLILKAVVLLPVWLMRLEVMVGHGVLSRHHSGWCILMVTRMIMIWCHVNFTQAHQAVVSQVLNP